MYMSVFLNIKKIKEIIIKKIKIQINVYDIFVKNVSLL